MWQSKIPSLMKVYPGMSLEDVLNLTLPQFVMLWEEA